MQLEKVCLRSLYYYNQSITILLMHQSQNKEKLATESMIDFKEKVGKKTKHFTKSGIRKYLDLSHSVLGL